MTSFLVAYGVALLWAAGRAIVLYAAGAALVAGATSRFGRLASRLTRGKVERGAERIGERGALGVAKGYLVPGVCEATQVMAGMARMPVATFAKGLLLAAVPWAVIDATIGSSIVASLSSGTGLLLVLVAAGGLLVWSQRDRLRTHLAWSQEGTVTMAA